MDKLFERKRAGIQFYTYLLFPDESEKWLKKAAPGVFRCRRGFALKS